MGLKGNKISMAREPYDWEKPKKEKHDQPHPWKTQWDWQRKDGQQEKK